VCAASYKDNKHSKHDTYDITEQYNIGFCGKLGKQMSLLRLERPHTGYTHVTQHNLQASISFKKVLKLHK